MKKLILVGIDFSKGSLDALEYATMLADKISADILMVWVGKGKDVSPVYAHVPTDLSFEVRTSFEKIIKKKAKTYPNINFSYKIRSGKVYKEIVAAAKYHEAFLIVAGTHGTSGFEEFWIGSNSYKIVTYAPCPVITVRYGEAAKNPIRRIVMPIDSTRSSRQKVPFVTTLAKYFDAEVHIVGLYSSTVKSIRILVNSYVDQVAKHFDKQEVKYQITTLEAENITVATIEYSKDIDADIIAIMTEQETTASNILLGPYAQQMVNHSPIPVLSVHARSLYDYQVD